MKKLIILFVFLVIILTQTSIFVIPPIGALPEGKTLFIIRLQNGKFIDSPDAFCRRNSAQNLLCRGMAIASISNTFIILRLPYSDFLYSISLGK